MVPLCKIIAIGVTVIALAACGGKSSPPQNPETPVFPEQTPPGVFDPAGGGDNGSGTAAVPRTITQGEFQLTLLADGQIQQLVSVPVHVISADEDTASRLSALKAVDYWQSPYSGPVVISENFGQRGTSQRTVRVPSLPAKDFIVLAADLAAPPGGRDDRIIRVPLKLDYADPANPVARPIRVRLTPSGWQREN